MTHPTPPNTELAACPFCGFDNPKCRDLANGGSLVYAVLCTSCNSEGSWKITPELAIKAWNTRHPKPMVQAEATLREDGGEPCCDVDLNETVWHDKYHQLCERCWKALGITEYTGLSIPEHIAALKNPSDAGGEESHEFDMEEALNKAEYGKE